MTGTPHGHAPRTRADTDANDAGFTLAEMMVALFVIGIVLAALASVLMNSLRTIVLSESESAATALVQQELERMVAASWDFAGLLEEEVAAAPTDWGAELDDPGGTFEGLDLAIIVPPEGATQRPAQSPLLRSTSAELELDDRLDFTVLRYVTWVDRTGDDVEETRRFTVIVTWTELGRSGRLQGSVERSPTQLEAGASEFGVRLLNFFRSPDPAMLDDSDANSPVSATAVQVEVRLNQGVSNGQLAWYEAGTFLEEIEPDVFERRVRYELSGTPMTPVAGSLAANGGHARWLATIPADSPFVTGAVPLQFTATLLTGGDFEAYGSVNFLGSEHLGTYPSPPSVFGGEEGDLEGDLGDGNQDGETEAGTPVITSAQIVGSVCRNPTTWKVSRPVLLRVQTTGLDAEAVLNATYTYRAVANTGNGHVTTATETVDHVSGNEAAATFELVIPAAADRHFAAGDTIDFHVVATRADGQNTATTTARATFVNEGTSPCN